MFEKAGHCFLVGDGAKQAKECRRMLGVKKLAQESETQSKPEYWYGHHWGCAGVLIGREKTLSCVLLSARIHDGLQAVKDWDGSAVSGDSHVVEMNPGRLPGGAIFTERRHIVTVSDGEYSWRYHSRREHS